MKTSSWPVSRPVAALLVAGLLLAGGAWAFRARSADPAAPAEPGTRAGERVTGDASPAVAEGGVAPEPIRLATPLPAPAPTTPEADAVPREAGAGLGAAPTLPEPERARLLEKIQAAAARYDATAIPELKPHLLHPDPELREAARDAMMQLGVAEAAEALREAAAKVRDPREAVALLDAADFVELPPALPAKARPSGAPASTTSPSPRRPMSKKAAN